MRSLVKGTVESIIKARADAFTCITCHKKLKTKTGKLFNANRSRGPSSYMKNNPDEIEFYSEGFDALLIMNHRL